MKKFDVVIAGGGVIGTMIGYFLARDREHSVAIVDIKKPGNATRASVGGLWAIGESVGLGCGVIFFKTLSRRIAEGGGTPPETKRPHQLPQFFFDFCLESNAMFPELWRRMREEHGVDFELERTGLKFLLFDQHDVDYARQIADSIPHLAHHLRWLDADELRREEPHVSDRARSALMFLNDDQVNPYALMQAAREAAAAHGAELFTECEVTGVQVQGERVTGVSTTRGELGCDTLINAAGAWAPQIARMATGQELPVMPIKGQIVLSDRLPRILDSCLSTSDCYLAQKANGEVLIGSTTEQAGFSTHCTLDAVRTLSRAAVRCVPTLRRASIKRTWAGLRPGTPDEIPILGPAPGVQGYLNACGHFRTGILTAPITAAILRALVRGEQPPLDLEPFLLERFERSTAAPLAAVHRSP